jgi:hypothetical protein
MKSGFASPWAASPSTLRRDPTTTEQTTGIPCGPFDVKMWNEMFYRLTLNDAELQSILAAAGITPNEADTQQVLKALQILFPLLPTGSTFYVNASTGSDSNSGTSGSPWATITKAVAVVSKKISSSAVTINVAAGTYAGVNIPPSFISSWNFVGSGASTCTINGTTTTASQGRAVLSGFGANVTMTGFAFASYYENVNVQPGGSMILNNCNFTQGSGGGNSAIGVYGYCQLIGSCNFANGTYSEFLLALQGGNIRVGYHDSFITQAVTLNFGTSTVTNGTVMAQQGGSFAFDPSTVTFSGAVTGPRFNAVYGGSIGTNGSGLSYLPGSVAGGAPTGYYF